MLADCGAPERIIFSGKIIEFDPISDDEELFPDRQLWFHDPQAHGVPDPSENRFIRRVLESYGCQDLRNRIGNHMEGELDRIRIDMTPEGLDVFSTGEVRLRFDLR